MAEMRKCVGSERFGLPAHEAPIKDFPIQPSQKDGIGRMCKEHWRQYVTGLNKARKAAQTIMSAEQVEAGALKASRRKTAAARATSESVVRMPIPEVIPEDAPVYAEGTVQGSDGSGEFKPGVWVGTLSPDGKLEIKRSHHKAKTAPEAGAQGDAG